MQQQPARFRLVRTPLLWRLCLPALLLLLGWAGHLPAPQAAAWARAPLSAEPNRHASLGEMAPEDLPKQGRVVYAQIQQGGPFAFDKDGTVFGNYERRLPRQNRGYYREYTVAYNAASRSRGPRRIVCGGLQPRQPDACYYSADHYNSFLRITPAPLRPSQRIQAQPRQP